MADQVKITLSFGERRILLMLADRGRHVLMDPTNFKPDVQDSLREMAVSGLISVTEQEGRSVKEYHLTDFGARIVDDMKKRFKDEVEEARKQGSSGFKDCSGIGTPED